MDNPVKMFTTSCANCIFNKGEKEVDCQLGRYERFEERGELKDGVVNRLCSACRDTNWLNLVDGNPVERMKNELANSYSIIIFDNHKGVLERLKQTLSVKQTIPARQIIVVYSDDVPNADVSREISYHIRDSETEYFTIKTFGDKTDREMIDLAVKKVTGTFYILCEGGDHLDEQAVEIMYTAIDVYLRQIIYVRPYNKLSLTGSVINNRFHYFVNGNTIKNIEEKLQEALIEDKDKDYYKDWTDLCLN